MTNQQLAEAWRPHVYCEIRDGSDVLCPLPPIEDVDKRTWEFPNEVHKAPVYFRAMQGDGWKSVLYMFYFRNDPKARHLHDLTGFLLWQQPDHLFRLILRQHFTLELKSKKHPSLDWVGFTAGSHTPVVNVVDAPIIDYGNEYPLADIDTIDIEPYRKAFAPSVTFPDRWSDPKLDNWLKKTPKGRELAKKHNTKTVRGLIWSAPDKLIEIMEAEAK